MYTGGGAEGCTTHTVSVAGGGHFNGLLKMLTRGLQLLLGVSAVELASLFISAEFGKFPLLEIPNRLVQGFSTHFAASSTTRPASSVICSGDIPPM